MTSWDEARIQCLEAQIKSLRTQNKFLMDWHDTCNTRLYKRIWFVIKGYKFFALGTWYNAPWNKDGQDYN